MKVSVFSKRLSTLFRKNARIGAPSVSPSAQGVSGSLGVVNVHFWILTEGTYLFEMKNLESTITSDVILKKFWCETDIS